MSNAKRTKESGRQPVDTIQFGVRIDYELRRQLDRIAKFEHATTPSDLVRTWIRLQVNSYRANRAYQAWEAREAAERVLAKSK